MTDEITHTILPNSGSGWGGTALGAGFGGLIGSWLGNGFGGFGGNRAAAGIGYDTGALNGIQGQLNNVSGHQESDHQYQCDGCTDRNYHQRT